MSIDNELQSRKQKLQELKKAGIEVYPERYETNATIQALHALTDELPDLPTCKDSLQQTYTIAGRVITWREHGKLIFCHLQDGSAQIQIAFAQDVLGADQFGLLQFIDRGDWLGVAGDMFITQKGEETLLVHSWKFLGKALRPLPEKWHGLKDIELRYRQRYLDLIMNAEARRVFEVRHKLVAFIRDYLQQHNFTEVDTPILTPTASGALAKPFVTHHNALDHDFYLRIAPELYLKRLIAGGYARVFEFARCFRNEGIDPSHLQDFVMLEYYAAFWNWEDNMKFTEQLISEAVKHIFGSYETVLFDQQINWEPPYPVVTFRDVVLKDCGIDIDLYDTADALRQEIEKKGITLKEGYRELGLGNLIDELYKKVSRPKLIQPTFLTGHPISLSPLARQNDDNPKVVDRFQLLVNGWEVLNAYSELVDPEDQRQRLEEQASLKAEGDEEAMMMDEDYLLTMEYGMPPISGWGMGIARFVSLLTSQENIKDTVLFPLLRPKNAGQVDVGDSKDLTAHDAGISREEAWDFVQEKITNPNLQKHALAVEFVMRAFARHFKEDETVWGIAGLLHDVDYEVVGDDLSKHCIVAEEWLQEKGVHPVIIQAIKAHNFSLEEPKTNYLAKTLYAVEELTGIITACALVQPDKKLASVSVDSVKKKFKQKSFAAGVNRDIIKEAETLLGLTLEEVFTMTLVAMQDHADELGL